ncbi:hypothetical protein BKA62DRAFT_12882 [Auriculariales sp. MPI-PUGE-AT-0066]|nr:hypothetical protein BKA62DRAFT_12882 [Auriculariales sp. MPI-PUGE-AT-0066]
MRGRAHALCGHPPCRVTNFASRSMDESAIARRLAALRAAMKSASNEVLLIPSPPIVKVRPEPIDDADWALPPSASAKSRDPVEPPKVSAQGQGKAPAEERLNIEQKVVLSDEQQHVLSLVKNVFFTGSAGTDELLLREIIRTFERSTTRTPRSSP